MDKIPLDDETKSWSLYKGLLSEDMINDFRMLGEEYFIPSPLGHFNACQYSL